MNLNNELLSEMFSEVVVKNETKGGVLYWHTKYGSNIPESLNKYEFMHRCKVWLYDTYKITLETTYDGGKSIAVARSGGWFDVYNDTSEEDVIFQATEHIFKEMNKRKTDGV